MKPFVKQALLVLAIIVFVIIYSSIYIISEGEEGLLLRLGKIVTDAQDQPKIVMPGLHWKWPVIDDNKIFDTRLHTLSIDGARVLTQTQQYVTVDYYAKWRINNLPLYFARTGGDSDQAEQLLQQKLNDSLRNIIGRLSLQDVIDTQRSNIMQTLQDQIKNTANQLGIEVIDVRIKRVA